MLATETISADRQQRKAVFGIKWPNLGPADPMTKGEMEYKGYVKITDAQAEPIWNLWYQYCHANCYHGDTCSTRRRGHECHTGSRLSDMHLICGAGLSTWMRLQEWHNKSKWASRYQDGKPRPLRIIKCITTEGGARPSKDCRIATCRAYLSHYVSTLTHR